MARVMRSTLALVPFLAVLGCSDETLSPTPLPPRSLDAGALRLEITAEPRLVLSREGETLLDLGPDGLALGVIDAVSDDHNYDPYWLYEDSPLYDVPEDLRWLTPRSAAFRDDAGVSLDLDYGSGITASLDVEIFADGTFALRWTPSASAQAAFMRLGPDADASEGFYGLGEYFDAVNHRGHLRAMQIEAGGGLESSYNEAHVPVPFLVGTKGWGLFVESQYPGAFAVATQNDRRIEAAFGTGTASSEGLTFYLMGDAHPLDVTRHYYEVTGFPGLPARWALGPWVWRDENDDQAQVESDLDIIRALDLATTGMWIDRPYATGVNTFDFEAAKFPDPDAMIAKMHDLGFRTAVWHTPYLDEGDPATASLRAEAEAGGYYPLETAIKLNGWGLPLDLTNPDAVAFWQSNLKAYVDMGIEGFKLDYGEDIIGGLFFNRTPWVFADGSDERTMHARYARVYHDTYRGVLPDSGFFLICRAGTYGDQVNATIIWPGDLDASFARHGEKVDAPGGAYTAVGGLYASIVAGLSLGPSGFPYFGADTGGYRHSPVPREVFMRWFEQTAFSTVMQIGTSANDVAWELGGENGFDQETLDRYRDYTRIHLRLFPYLWSYVTRLAADGRPIARALGLAHPELDEHPDDTYLLGDALLIAPVTDGGVTKRPITFPEGRWVHWFTGEEVVGPTSREVDAPLGRIPVFISDASLVPMLRPTIDTLAPVAGGSDVDSYATRAGLLYVRGVAGGNGSFELFDGGRVEQISDGATSRLVSHSGSELDEGAIFELLAAEAPASVGDLVAVADLSALEAATSGYLYEAGTLWVKVPAGDGEATITW